MEKTQTPKILIIDDDQDLTKNLTAILESRNYKVITAPNGTEGLEKFKKEAPDLLILDIMMDTDLEGFDVLNKIKKEPDFRKTPILMLTGMADSIGVNFRSAVEDDSMYPKVAFADKPIDPVVLLEEVEKLINKS